MAEAEDVITDVARHATVYAQALWQRHRSSPGVPHPLALSDVAERLDLLIYASFGRSYPLRVAQPPALPTFLEKLFRRVEKPYPQAAIPATDDQHIWLPAQLGIADPAAAQIMYRSLALQQAMRAQRGSAAMAQRIDSALQRSLYRLLEAWAADAQLLACLPGLRDSLQSRRNQALATRPPLARFTAPQRAREQLLRRLLQSRCGEPLADLPLPASSDESRQLAEQLAARLYPPGRPMPGGALLADLWIGELRIPAQSRLDASSHPEQDPPGDTPAPRGARLSRRPQVREAIDGEDDEQPPGVWMVQPSPPQEHAEDPLGMQRPTDRDQATPAEDFADSLAELNEARLVLTPGSPKEVLLSDELPDRRALRQRSDPQASAERLSYPEWDYQNRRYRTPGAMVQVLAAPLGPQQWVEQTLATHRSMLAAIRRQFEMLRAQRLRLRRQLDGDEVDLDAYLDGLAEARAGLSMPQALYQTQRTNQRDMAIMLLVDASGSTDGWLSSNRRVIDVEREALLLVCLALEGLGEPYSVQSFSGEGPLAVTLRSIKGFAERYDNATGRRIAGLEPERYTRAGAAIRHASNLLMGEPAAHRLLLLLSDGKPNDVDEYEGRYGVEDMRQAVTEAKLQGIYPFCLTIDRQAANYLPAVFGARQYALLPKPELLPTVLLDWLKRLLQT
ncbi:hypothetical protein P8H27_13480 [Pseudomonas sp. sp1636]|uniref:hypothetical protein n=1 Tax=Pseudomonas sp. sp1636 TaxID=3036707 RepID=UPI0025A5FAFF|nr:hypothetical protein [Pseudomonas sp. sp1636]MDM8349898.1 hypothetical protein [Pseudomonas sp. sp1636]